MMDHRASESVKDRPQMKMTIKSEVEVAATSIVHIDSEEPWFVQSVKNEPVLSVIEEILEDNNLDGDKQQCVRGASTPPGTGSANEACSTSLRDLLNVKHEPSELDIGPTVFQHMDVHYKVNKQTTSDVTEENVIVDDCNKPILCNGIKKESIEEKLKGSPTPQTAMMEESHACCALQSLQLTIHKDRLESICEVQLMRLDTFQCEFCNAVFAEKRLLLRHLQSVHRSHLQTTSLFLKFHKTNKQKSTTGADEQQGVPATSARTMVGRTKVAAEIVKQGKLLDNKKDLGDIKLGIGPKHMDSHYKTSQIRLRSRMSTRSTHDIVARSSVAADSVEQGELVHIKEELENTELDIGPTVLQHMDSYYRRNQMDLNVIKHNQLKDETTEASQKDSSSGHSKSGLVSHLQNMHEHKSYGCKVCKKNFASQQSVLRHTWQAHRGEVHKHQSYRCDKCLKVFKTATSRWQHSKRVHETESHNCTHCVKVFKCKEYLQYHVRNTHSKQQYNCDVCKEICTSRATLRYHISSFHRYSFTESEDGNYRCDKCMKPFQSKSLLMNHYKNIHQTDRQKCIECNKEFKCKTYLQYHINNVHSKEQYECDICKKLFKSKQRLRRHILRGHCGRFPSGCPGLHTHKYTCDYCQKAFWSKQAVRHHIEGVHGERIHRCLKCYKAFSSRNRLQLHETSVHSKPQHECEVCHRRFTTKCILRGHIKKTHGLGDI